jgi:DeoR family suf operon transcriptional repressor
MIDFGVKSRNFQAKKMTTSTRNQILRTLLINQRRTVNELAEAVNINPISVRHHVNKLEADGIIESDEERHGVGRPRLVYSLTSKGMDQFPKRYLQLTLRLLQQLKANLPQEQIGEIFQELADNMADEFTRNLDLEKMSLKERLEHLQRTLTAEGYTVNLLEEDENYFLVEASCPYHHVGEDHPEICVVDQQLIARFISSPPRRVECILNGDSQCKYQIKKELKDG